MGRTSRRQDLLAALVAELGRRGLSGRSLRDLAEAVGTSHRMLIHHFGSRDGLLAAVVEAVEAGERAHLEAAGDLDGPGVLAAGWNRLADPARHNEERLFFACYARALEGREPFRSMLPGLVTDWLAVVEAGAGGGGDDAERAVVRARLDLAVFRGLLLDLLATDDPDGVRAAFDLHLAGRSAASTPS